MMDAMTGPLKSVTSSMNMVISSMQQMQRTANSNMNIDKTLASAKKQLALAEVNIAKSIASSTTEQQKFNRAMHSGESASDSLLSNIKAMAAAYLSIESAKRLFGSTIGGAMEQQKMEDMFVARTGDAEVGKAMFEKFKADALAAGQDVTKSLQSSLSFFSTTQNVDQLTKLNNLAQRLNAFDSAGNGIEGAAFALKEAMSGDIVSLAERFNMSKTDIRAFNIDEYGKAGDMENFIKSFDLLLEKQKMGQAAFDTMMESPAKQLEILGNNMTSMFAGAGVAAMESLLPLITMLNTAFQSGTFDSFFSSLSAGLNWAVQGALRLLDAITTVYSFFAENWSWISPILFGVGTALLTVYSALKLVAIGQAIVNAVMNANPFVLVATAVIALIAYFYKLWKTNDAFAAGVMRVWNFILNFFSTVPAYFWTVVEGIAQAFKWWAGSIGKIFDAVINSIISGINSVLSLINKITGSSYEIAAKFNFENIADSALAYAGAKKDAAYESAAAKAAEREQAVMDMINNRKVEREAEANAKAAQTAGGTQPYDFTDWNKAADAARTPAAADDGKKKNIGKVDKVGKIEKEVDISSEDLKTMRELAEMKNIQNYVTLTPTVQVTTGDINNGMDIDSIVSRIEDVMAGEITHHAAGVYGNG